MSMSGSLSRQLIWIPILHTQADLGSLSKSVQEAFVRRLGQAEWDLHQRRLEGMWDEIRRLIGLMNLDYSRVRLYQDGLPICGQEEQIVRDLAKAGSRNHSLLLEMMEKGALLTGTESPQLLLEEYQLAGKTLQGVEAGSRSARLARAQQVLGKRLLERRDTFIAERINQTLEPGFTGQVYLGRLHNLAGKLAPDIQLHRLEVSV